MTDPKHPATVRVRVAVVADNDGRWSAFGADETHDEVMASELSGVVGEPSRLTFIEADIPLPPSPETVAGEVAARPVSVADADPASHDLSDADRDMLP